ncbi:MAG: DUF6318 family protein [Dermatophilaceae bacterium]
MCVVASCSRSSEQPAATPTSGDSPTSSVSASATTSPSTPTATATAEPVVPADARPATAEGAQKFVAYWVSQFNVAFRTANAESIQAISTEECVACQGFISDVETLRTNGEHAEADVWTINDSYIEAFDNVGAASVIATIRQNHVARIGPGGTVVASFNERTEDAAFTLHHTGSGWRVTKFQVVK